MIIGTVRKQPVERRDFDIDFSEYLGEDDALLPSPLPTVGITPTGALNTDLVVVMTAAPYNSQFLKIWLVDGNDGVTYKVTVTATSAAGRIKQVEFKVKVKDD